MKSISLYVEQDTYLTRLHPFAKLFYILAAVTVPLITGKMWVFVLFIAMSLCLLVSGRIAARVFPLIAFSFTIIATVFLIHGLFNQANRNVLFVLGPFKFYREGLVYAARIGFNILNMLLAFAAFVLSTKPDQLVDDLEQIGFSPQVWLYDKFRVSDHTPDDGHYEYHHGCPAEQGDGDGRKPVCEGKGVHPAYRARGQQFPDQYKGEGHCAGGQRV